MGQLTITVDTSGTLTLAAPSAAGTPTITISIVLAQLLSKKYERYI